MASPGWQAEFQSLIFPDAIRHDWLDDDLVQNKIREKQPFSSRELDPVIDAVDCMTENGINATESAAEIKLCLNRMVYLDKFSAVDQSMYEATTTSRCDV